MNCIIFILVGLPIIVSGASLSGSGSVVDLSSPRILASDLANAVPAFTAADGETSLGPSPRPGFERRVSRAVLLRWAARLGLSMEPDEAPTSLLLRRRMRRLSAEETQGILERAAADALHLPAEEIRVELREPSEPLVPDAKLELSLGSRIPALNRPVRLRLTWREPGGTSGQQIFDATVRARGSYLVAKRSLPARAVLIAADFSLVEDWMPEGLGEGYINNFEQIEYKSLKRSMKVGEALSEELVVDGPAITRGALVELRIVAGGVRLRAPARAEDSGRRGELIAFRNLASGRRVLAVVVDAKAAEVQSP